VEKDRELPYANTLNTDDHKTSADPGYRWYLLHATYSTGSVE